MLVKLLPVIRRPDCGFRGNHWVKKWHIVICICKSNSIALFLCRQCQTKNTTGFHQWHTKCKSLWVCMQILLLITKLKKVVRRVAFFSPVCVVTSHLRKKRRRCQQVLECPSLWAMLSTQRPSTMRTWGKRWSSWCWIRRTVFHLLMVRFRIVQLGAFYILFTDRVLRSCRENNCLANNLPVPLYIQMSQQTGRRSCSRSCRSTRWWPSQTTKMSSGIKRSRRCSRLMTARHWQCVFLVQAAKWARMNE